MDKLYESIVTSRTYDVEENVMYPEKISKERTYEEMRRLISQGHTLEIRDGSSNVEVDNTDLLDELYKPVKDETEKEEDINTVSISDPTTSIVLPDGRVVNVSEIMSSIGQNQDTGKPQYLPKTDELPQITVPPFETTVSAPELSSVQPTPQSSEESAKTEEETKVEEETKEEKTGKKNKSKKEEENK